MDAQNCDVWSRHSHTVLIDPYDQVGADGIRKTIAHVTSGLMH